MRLIITRPADQAADWVSELQRLGVDAQALPLIAVAPPHDVWLVHAAWATLPGLALVMFVSANAVAHFFSARPADAAWPPALPGASTGPGTSAALRAAGVAQIEEPPADAAQFDSEALWARLRPRDWRGREVLIVRGEEGRDWLGQTLAAQGAQVRFVAAYRRVPPVLDAAGRVLLARARVAPAAHAWVFSSSEAIGHLTTLAPAAVWTGSLAIASHPRIASAARRAGFGQVELLPPIPQALAERFRTA